jgi:internalin A
MGSPDQTIARQRIAAELAAQTGKLDLSGLQLSELPLELRALTSLKSLNCSFTQMSDLEPLRGLNSLQILDCSRTQVSDLEPLQGLVSLQILDCTNTQVSDLEPLRGLFSLQILNCSFTDVSDLKPLRSLARLLNLNCSFTEVSVLKPLRSLASLQFLNCSFTKVSDLKPLRSLARLQFFNCSFTKVSDLQPLPGLASLQILNCSFTRVSDLKRLQRLTSLKDFNCRDTQVTDLNPLCGLANLQILNCSDTKVSSLEPLRGLDRLQNLNCSDTQVSDLDPLRGLTSLQILNCDDTQVSDLVPLRGLADLQILNCSDTEVSDLEPLRGLTGIKNLDCTNTQVSNLDPLRGLASLRNLYCSGTQVNDLDSLRGLTSLQIFDCSNTQVSVLAPLQDLANLHTLKCNFTQVRDLDPLRDHASLETMSCSGTEVSDLGPLQSLAFLQHLDCGRTHINDLEPLRGLASLQTLKCAFTHVKDLDPLRGLANLQTLNCSDTQVSSLKPLRSLASLQNLNCGCTQVSDLEPLRSLTNLKNLNCGFAKMKDLESLRGLTKLQSLSCRYSQVSSLEPLRGLTSLQNLDCSFTQVSDLGPLRGLTNLQNLNCSVTQVSDLEAVVDLQNLQTLKCEKLKISEFPRKLLFSEKLQELYLDDSSIRDVPAEAFSSDSGHFSDNCLPTLRAHVLDREEEEIPSNSVKILVLGNGGVGKTQLCRHLAAEAFDPSVPSTHGIALRTIAPTSEGDATYFIWDFGGQDVYHSAHTLFMRTAAVFVVLWTPEQEALVASDNDDDPLQRRHPLTYWLDYVRTLGRADSPVLVVQSQCDTPAQAVPVPPVDAALLQSFGCLSVCNFSSRTRRGAASLQEALADANTYLRDRDGISSIGRGRHQVWQQLETWRQADQQLPPPERLHRTLSQVEFARLCEQIGGVSSPEALLRFLHNKGVVFHSPDLFHNRILLDQSWALDAVYAVFERGSTYPLIKANDGRLSPSLLAAIVWREYEPEAQELFLSLMCTCGIVFPYREADATLGQEAEYLAPDLLPPRSSPQVGRQLQGRWDGSDPSLTLTYSYRFLHGGLVRALLCDLGNHAGDGGVYWRYGAWVYDARQGCIALLEQQMENERAGTISICFQGAGSTELADWFMQRLAERNRQFGYADLQPTSSGALASQTLASEKRQRQHPSNRGEASAAPPPELVPAPVETFLKPSREVFISYAHGDASPEGKERQRIVDRLVEVLHQHPEPIAVRIDREVMRPGDLISAFMDRLAAADRVIVVISAKYLRSEYCMYELFMLYQNCRKKAGDFHRRIIPIILPDAGLSERTATRFRPVLYWKQEAEELGAIVAANRQEVGTSMHMKYRLIGEFASNSSDMIEYLYDQLQPRDYDRQMEESFPELCEQILAG